MILSHDSLIEAWKDKEIRFKPDISEDQIGESSIDLRLGHHVTRLVENKGVTIEPAFSDPAGLYEERKKGSEGFVLDPGELVLVKTLEDVSLPPNLCASVEGRSSYARHGLAAHITSPHINPSWDGQITLELFNHNPNRLRLKVGERLCQLIIFQVTTPIPLELRGKSRYQHQKHAAPAPEVKK